MSSSALRVISLSTLAAVTFAAPVAALAADHGHHAAKPSHGNKHHGKPAEKHFTATGVVTAVDAGAGTVTIADKGGSRELHGTTVTIAVSATTKITRDDASATLADLQSGDHVAANGLRGSDGSLNAKHVNASSPQPTADSASPEPADSASPEPSDSPSAAPTDSPTVAPTDSPTVAPTDSSSATTTG